MQITPAVKAFKELPLEGSCSPNSVKCPAWNNCGPPTEKYFQSLVSLLPGTSFVTAQEGHCDRAP